MIVENRGGFGLSQARTPLNFSLTCIKKWTKYFDLSLVRILIKRIWVELNRTELTLETELVRIISRPY